MINAQYDVLVFSKTAGYRHESIPAGVRAIRDIGKGSGFLTVDTEEGAVFDDADLDRYGAIIWLSTSGDVLEESQKSRFEEYIRGGGAFVGIHAATDTEAAWPFYQALTAATFHSHPGIHPAVVRVEDVHHPAMRPLPSRWQVTDEWYNFRISPRGRVHVLATVDEMTYPGGSMGSDHPISWCHEYEGGRAWYTGLGHTDEAFQNPLFRAHLLGGIESVVRLD